MSSIPYPEVILFDWDGTLIDTYKVCEEAHNQVHKALGIDIKPEGWLRPYFGLPRDEGYKLFYGQSTDEIDQIYINFIYDNAHLLEAMPEAEAFLQNLNKTGMICGVVTNKRQPLSGDEIKHFKWDAYFNVVVGANEAKHNKPAPDPIFLALERLGYTGDMDKVWMIGDTDNDQKAAKGAGCQFIAYIDKNTAPLDDSIYQPIATVGSYAELERFVQSLKK